MAVSALNGMNYFCNPYSNYANYSGLYNMYDSYDMGGNLYGMGMPSFTGMNLQPYYNNMMSNLNFTSNYQLGMMENQRNFEITANGPQERIRNAVATLNDKIVGNEQEQIMGAYVNLKEAIRAMYPNASEADIAARANTFYTQCQNVSITNDIRAHGTNSFWQGFKQVIGLGIFAEKKTAEENIAEITGQPVARTSKTAKIAGHATAGAVVGAGIGALVGGPIGSAIGAVIGAIAGGAGGQAIKKG